jgi:hypothetical protein
MNWVERKSLVAIYPNSLKGELGTSEIVHDIASKVLTATIFILRHKTYTSFQVLEDLILFKIEKFMTMVH